MTQQRDIIDIIVNISTIATPLLILLISGIGWKIRQSFERKITLERELRGDRVEIYNSILEPFIILLGPDLLWSEDKKYKGKNIKDEGSKKLLSLEYRELVFKLLLFGSDGVVKSYNDLLQFFFSRTDINNPSLGDIKNMMRLFGGLLIEIRKSMGNETTELTEIQMLESFITDARKIAESS